MSKAASKKTSVLYLFMGLNRAAQEKLVEQGLVPKSQFRGFQILKQQEDLDVRFLDLWELPHWIPETLRKNTPPLLRQLIQLPRVLSYRYVIVSDVHLIGYVASLVGKLTGSRWIYIPMNSSVLMRRHAKHPVRLWALTCMWRSYWRIAYISELQRQDLKSIGVHEQQLFSLPFGIDAEFFKPQGKPNAERFVLSVGRDLGRDYETLLEVAKLLPYKFVIATARKNIPEGTALPENVEVKYDVNAPGIRELYRDAAFVVLLLKDEETIEGSDCTGQTVMLEALSAGKAVVATDRAWTREYFTAGVEYEPVPPGEVSEVVQTITRLYESPDYCRALGAAGQARVATEYSLTTFAGGLLSLIRSQNN